MTKTFRRTDNERVFSVGEGELDERAKRRVEEFSGIVLSEEFGDAVDGASYEVSKLVVSSGENTMETLAPTEDAQIYAQVHSEYVVAVVTSSLACMLDAVARKSPAYHNEAVRAEHLELRLQHVNLNLRRLLGLPAEPLDKKSLN